MCVWGGGGGGGGGGGEGGREWERRGGSGREDGPEPTTSNTLNQYKFTTFHDIQYFSENLAY